MQAARSRRGAALAGIHAAADRGAGGAPGSPICPDSDLLDELTPREREVVALVAARLSNEQIAARLFVTPATAKTHVSRAMVKLHARDRAQVVVFAYETGLALPRVSVPSSRGEACAIA